MLSGTIIASELSDSASSTEFSATPQFTAISEHSLMMGTPSDIEEWLTSLRLDSHVSHSQQVENSEPEKIHEICGQKPFARFEKSGQNSHCWKTRQCFLPGLRGTNHTSPELSKSFPASGMWEGGGCYRQPHWDSITGVIVYGLLPTPVKQDGHGFYRVKYDSSLRRWISRGGQRNRQFHWMQFAVLSKRLKTGIARPQFAEAMMGWPIGWTDLEPLEMDKFRQWSKQYGKDLEDEDHG